VFSFGVFVWKEDLLQVASAIEVLRLFPNLKLS